MFHISFLPESFPASPQFQHLFGEQLQISHLLSIKLFCWWYGVLSVQGCLNLSLSLSSLCLSWLPNPSPISAWRYWGWPLPVTLLGYWQHSRQGWIWNWAMHRNGPLSRERAELPSWGPVPSCCLLSYLNVSATVLWQEYCHFQKDK